MKEFLEEAFRVERDLVRLSYWISSLPWGHYSPYTEDKAQRAKRDLDKAIDAVRALRGEVKQKED